jgi:phenylalanyl-tRNA synthetase beta chain
MPTIKIAKKRFNELMGIDFTFEKLEDLGFEYGIEIEEDSEEDMESEIDPKTKTRKRIEFFRFECTNNRPDLLCEASLTRSLLLYLGKRKMPCRQDITCSSPNRRRQIGNKSVDFRSSKSVPSSSVPS